MSYEPHVEKVIDEIISAFAEKRVRDCHWIDLQRLKRFNFEKDAPHVYGWMFNQLTGNFERVQIIPPFLSTWEVAKGFPTKKKEDIIGIV